MSRSSSGCKRLGMKPPNISLDRTGDAGVFARPEILVSMAEALHILETHAPEVLVLEVVSDHYEEPARRQQRNSHPIPGFAQIKTEQLETDLLWNLRPDPHLQQILTAYDLAPETAKQILLFDHIKLACGRAESRFDASARLFSVLYYFGFSHVSIILDSDVHSTFPDEFAAQYPQIVHRLAQPPSTEVQRSKEGSLDQTRWVPQHGDYFVSYETMVQMLSGKLGPYRLLDARSAEEYAGIFTGYDYIPLAGRIPTAESVINGDYQVSATESLALVLARLATTLAGKGIEYEERIVWYCGTGWRASRMCALTQALGYTNVAIYDGGWNEWHRRHPEDGVEKPWGIEP
jgi:molybdopterin synthase sulfurtransferase